MTHDYIPKNDDELFSFAKNLYAYALLNFARWQIPSFQTFLRTGNKPPPPLVKGAAFAHRLQEPEEAPAKAEEMPSVFQTVKNFQWGEESYGKAVDYACAYENEGGKRGPWSDVSSLIIT